MEEGYGFLLDLAIILLAAHIGGLLSAKLKQPAVLGQIIAGLILGAGLMEKTAIIEHFAQIGVVMLMFVAGLETDVKELFASIKSSSSIAIGGVILPAVLVVVGMFIFYPSAGWAAASFLGIVTTATSVSISVQTLREIGQMHTKQGTMILGAAIIDDVLGIILLTLLVSIVNPGASSSVGMVLIQVVGFFVIVYVVGRIILRLFRHMNPERDVDDKVITFSIILCFVFAFLSEELGIAAITGGYFAGVILSMTHYRHKITHEFGKISNFLFIPVFFVGVGMDIDLSIAFSALGIGLILIVLGSIGKVWGCAFGARITGFKYHEAMQIGVGMLPRAEVALIVAHLGQQMQVLTDKDMAASILMVLVSTLMTPSLLKKSFRNT